MTQISNKWQHTAEGITSVPLSTKAAITPVINLVIPQLNIFRTITKMKFRRACSISESMKIAHPFCLPSQQYSRDRNTRNNLVGIVYKKFKGQSKEILSF